MVGSILYHWQKCWHDDIIPQGLDKALLTGSSCQGLADRFFLPRPCWQTIEDLVSKKTVSEWNDEGQKLEAAVLESFTVANLPY